MSLRTLLSPRLFWRLLAVALMFGAAYSFARMITDSAMIGDLTGLPQYAATLPALRRQAEHSEIASVVLPFLAALALSLGLHLGRRSNDGSSRVLNYFPDLQWWRPFTIVVIYILNVAVSFFGSAACLLLMTLIVYLVYELR